MQIQEPFSKEREIDRAGNTTMFLIIEETKEAAFEFSQGTVKVLLMRLY